MIVPLCWFSESSDVDLRMTICAMARVPWAAATGSLPCRAFEPGVVIATDSRFAVRFDDNTVRPDDAGLKAVAVGPSAIAAYSARDATIAAKAIGEATGFLRRNRVEDPRVILDVIAAVLRRAHTDLDGSPAGSDLIIEVVAGAIGSTGSVATLLRSKDDYKVVPISGFCAVGNRPELLRQPVRRGLYAARPRWVSEFQSRESPAEAMRIHGLQWDKPFAVMLDHVGLVVASAVADVVKTGASTAIGGGVQLLVAGSVKSQTTRPLLASRQSENRHGYARERSARRLRSDRPAGTAKLSW